MPSSSSFHGRQSRQVVGFNREQGLGTWGARGLGLFHVLLCQGVEGKELNRRLNDPNYVVDPCRLSVRNLSTKAALLLDALPST